MYWINTFFFFWYSSCIFSRDPPPRPMQILDPHWKAKVKGQACLKKKVWGSDRFGLLYSEMWFWKVINFKECLWNLAIYFLTTIHPPAFGKISCVRGLLGWSWGPGLKTTTSAELTVPGHVASLIPRASTRWPWKFWEKRNLSLRFIKWHSLKTKSCEFCLYILNICTYLR